MSYRQVGRRARGQLRKGPAGRNVPEARGGGNGGRSTVAGRSSSSLDGRRTADSRGGNITRERTKASIPSRFETVLHHGATENDGFGSAASRFRAYDNDTPGPGKYLANSSSSTFVWNPELKGSISKKGYGGLVSNTNRFSNRAMYDQLFLLEMILQEVKLLLILHNQKDIVTNRNLMMIRCQDQEVIKLKHFNKQLLLVVPLDFDQKQEDFQKVMILV